MNIDVDQSESERLQEKLSKETGKNVKRINGTHGLILGPGILFELSPVRDTHVYVLFKESFFNPTTPRSGFIKQLAQRLINLSIIEPQVIEIDHNGVQVERSLKSYNRSKQD